jgi:hypothetical protein
LDVFLCGIEIIFARLCKVLEALLAGETVGCPHGTWVVDEKRSSSHTTYFSRMKLRSRFQQTPSSYDALVLRLCQSGSRKCLKKMPENYSINNNGNLLGQAPSYRCGVWSAGENEENITVMDNSDKKYLCKINL